jgi:hypothetical protein
MRLDRPQRAYLPFQRFTDGAKHPRRRFDKGRGFRKGTRHCIAQGKALNVASGIRDLTFEFGYGLPEAEEFLLPRACRMLSINTQAEPPTSVALISPVEEAYSKTIFALGDIFKLRLG